MDDTPQILDVSYGNFSCRLEGFDDSVETMKAVVSYFHELAGHNRFMDMAPQAPDMQTLARLTEDQSGSPVDVEADGNTVSLRQAVAEEVETETAVSDETQADVAEDLADDVTSEDPVAEEVIETEDQTDDVMDPEVAVDAADDEDVDDTVAENDDDVEGDTDHAPAAEDAITSSEARDVDEDDEDETFEDDADVFEMVDDGADPEDDIADDSVAAKLQRIRAVVTKDDAAETVDAAEDTFAEDNTSPEEPVITGNPLAQRLADLAKRNAERAAEEAGVELRIDDEDDDDSVTPEDLAELEAEFAEDDANEADVGPAKETSATLELAPEDRAGEDELADFAQAMREDDIDTTDDDASGPLVLTPDAEIPLDEDDDDFDLKKEVAEAQRSIEALGKGKGSDVLNNVNMNTTRILSQADEHLNEPEGRRHRDAFAQLKAAVAATEAARQLGDPGASKRDKDEAFREDLGAHAAEERSERNSRPLDSIPDDSSVTDETSDPIAQTASTSSEPITQPEDVAKPAAKAAEAPAPAPLKLVSSQVAEPAGKQVDVASARLREIASQKTTGGPAKGGFAEFAAQKGATELADLLEAAAAYIAFVEGDDDFSRPQVMKKVQAATKSEFSREDGLRSFGRLLRQSRIIKLNNGRFQVSEDTRFRPEDKAAQG